MIESPILTPTRTGGSSDGAGHVVRQVPQPTQRLTNHPERGAVTGRTILPVAGDMGDHEAWPRLLKRGVIQLEPGKMTWTEVLNDGVAFGC